jgi:O-antigen/teichoic acid export membrane protein
VFLRKQFFQPGGYILRIVGFIGHSGTGKSHRASWVARERGIEFIIDDGLLIKVNQVIAGVSAKKEKTRIGSIKRALFTDDQHMQDVKNAISIHKPEAILIIGTSGSLEFFAVGKYKVLYTADQKSYVISLINAVAVAINAVIILVLASLHFDIIIVQLVALVSFFVRSALYVLYGKLKYHGINYKAPPKNEALDKRWDSLFLQILGVVTTATPVVVTSLVLGFKETSVFVVYNMVFASVLALLTTFSGGLSAMFGDLLVRNEIGTLQKAYQQYEYLYYGLLAWGYACAAILIMPFLEIYTQKFTDADYIRPVIAALFVAVGILSNIKTPQGMLVISAGLYKETKIQSLIQAIINVVFSAALAPSLGIAGVLIGSILSNLYRDIDLIFFIPKTVTKLKPTMSIRRVLRLILLFSISVFPVIYYIDLKPGNLFSWALDAVPAAIWAFVVIAGGNIIIERKTASEIYLRIRGLFLRRLEGSRK